MCGRARASASFTEIARENHIPEMNIHDYWEEESSLSRNPQGYRYEPSCNVYPSRRLPIIIKRKNLDYTYVNLDDNVPCSNNYIEKKEDDDKEDRINKQEDHNLKTTSTTEKENKKKKENFLAERTIEKGNKEDDRILTSMRWGLINQYMYNDNIKKQNHHQIEKSTKCDNGGKRTGITSPTSKNHGLFNRFTPNKHKRKREEKGNKDEEKSEDIDEEEEDNDELQDKIMEMISSDEEGGMGRSNSNNIKVDRFVDSCPDKNNQLKKEKTKAIRHNDLSPGAYFKTFNCRIETALEKRLWRDLVDKKRCIVVVDGFYEWKKVEIRGKKKKQAHFIQLPASKSTEEKVMTTFEEKEGKRNCDVKRETATIESNNNNRSMMKIACFYDTYKSIEEEEGEENTNNDINENKIRYTQQVQKQKREKLHYTFTMLTRSPNTDNFFHDRIPVILPTRQMEDEWLDTDKYNGKDIINRFLTLYNYNYFDQPVSNCTKGEVGKISNHEKTTKDMSTFHLDYYAISNAIGKLDYHGVDSIIPQKSIEEQSDDEYDGGKKQKTLHKFFSSASTPKSQEPNSNNKIRSSSGGAKIQIHYTPVNSMIIQSQKKKDYQVHKESTDTEKQQPKTLPIEVVELD